MINLPPKYKERMKVLLGEDYDAYEKSLSEPPVRAFRVNTEKISVEDFEKICPFPHEKIPYSDNGFYFTYDKIGNHPFHHAGMIYVQEPGAMAPVECIDFDPDWTVLDMCAAPGGKSTQIRNKLGEKGVLVSNEIIPSRCKILTGNIERLGLRNTVTTCLDSKRIADIFPKTFDIITVDAPCSGEGMFRKEEIAVSEWSEENVEKCSSRQLEILKNAVQALKDGGYIIYATCTFSLEENERVIDEFLSVHSNFELVKVKEEVQKCTCDGIMFDGCKTESIKLCRRFYPHKNKGEGQFMAVLHSTLPPSAPPPPKKENHKVDKMVFDFLDSVLTDYDKEKVIMYNGNPVYFTPDFPVKKGTAFSCGVTIGEIKKNYIQPHHQFFMAMGKDFKRKIEFDADSPELKKYLHGEEITANTENGWAAVTVNGCAVGGIKAVSGKGKNHYPKGLRLKGV